MDNENKIQLLKKLKKLADSGIGGEKVNAQEMLSELMRKYDISSSDIETDVKELVWFRYGQDIERRLLSQIICMIMGGAATYEYRGSSGRKHKKVGVHCSTVECLEIGANFDFYKKALYEEQELFLIAFVHKNQLFPAKGCEMESTEQSSMSKSDIQKITMMMEGMDNHIFCKQIAEGKI